MLAELCQNNPYCQRVVIDNGMLKQLLDIVDRDSDNEARTKAVYAVSCNVRENEEGLEQFLGYGGVSSVLRAMQRDLDKLRTKCAFLLACLAGLHAKVRAALVKAEAVPLLVGLISEERKPSHEHLLSLLVGLVTDCPEATAQCTDPRYNFRHVLSQHLAQIAGKNECQVRRPLIGPRASVYCFYCCRKKPSIASYC